MDAIPVKITKRKSNLPPGPGPGRPKGSKNKFTTLKNAFMNVFHELGGEEWLLQRAQEPKRGASEFMQAMVKMLPTKIDADLSGSLNHTINMIDYSTIGKLPKKTNAEKQDGKS